MNTREQNPSPRECCKGTEKCLCAWLEYFNILNNQFLQGKKGSFLCRMGTFQKNCVTKNPFSIKTSAIHFQTTICNDS